MNWYDFIPYPLWVNGLSLTLVAIICLIVFFLLRRGLKKSNSRWVWHIPVYLFWIGMVVAIFIGDAYKASLQYNKLCREEAGLHIYKTVQNVESFLADSKSIPGGAIAYELGFKFTEYEKKIYGTNLRKQYFRLVENDGRTIHDRPTYDEIPIDRPVSKYYLFSEETILNTKIKKKRRVIKDLASGQILSEYVFFYYYPGWLDIKLWGWLGDYKPPICGKYEFLGQLKKTLLPKYISKK